MDIHTLLIACPLKFTVVTISTTCSDTEHNQYLLYFLFYVLDCPSLCARVSACIHACTHMYHTFKITGVKSMMNICSHIICACSVSHTFLASKWMVKQVISTSVIMNVMPGTQHSNVHHAILILKILSAVRIWW